LNIFLENSNNTPTNAAEISYALYDFTTGMEVLLGSPVRVPSNPSVGEYYASVVVPLDANLGSYRVRWTFRETVSGPIQQVVQEFDVIDKATLQTMSYTDVESDLIRRLRILLRDNKPDRNYHFRPPAHEETVQQFNRVFGFIWEDDELDEYLQRAMDQVIAAPPRTPFVNLDQFVQSRPEWRTLLLNGAMMHAIFAVMLNWIADEFDYSIGGVSLTIEKSSKYESAYQAIKDNWTEQLERAKQTVKIVKGLQQPKFGIGIRSAFGPFTGTGVLTPRKFVGF
jgi:cell wall assembly regulator SMI1